MTDLCAEPQLCPCGKRIMQDGLCRDCTTKLRWLRREFNSAVIPEVLRVIQDSTVYFLAAKIGQSFDVSVETVLAVCREQNIRVFERQNGLTSDPTIHRKYIPRLAAAIISRNEPAAKPQIDICPNPDYAEEQAEWVPASTVSKLLGVAPDTIRGYAAQGFLVPTRGSACFYWRLADVLDFRQKVLSGEINLSSNAVRKVRAAYEAEQNQVNQ